MIDYPYLELILTHNAHEGSCITLEQYLKEDCFNDRGITRAEQYEEYEEANKEQIEEMIAKDSIWELTVYPRTTIGSISFYRASYKEVVDSMNEFLKEYWEARENENG